MELTINKLAMELTIDKLKESRSYLKIRQTDLKKATGLSQNTISRLERNMRLHIPIEYLKYLQLRGIDIAAILNDNVTAEDFRRNPKNINLSLRADLSAANIRIKKLEDVVNNYSENIQDLRGQVGELQKKLDSRNPESKKGEQAG